MMILRMMIIIILKIVIKMNMIGELGMKIDEIGMVEK